MTFQQQLSLILDDLMKRCSEGDYSGKSHDKAFTEVTDLLATGYKPSAGDSKAQESPTPSSLREQIHRLIVENRNSLNDPTTNEPYDMEGIAEDVIELIALTEIDALQNQLDEILAWSKFGARHRLSESGRRAIADLHEYRSEKLQAQKAVLETKDE